MNPEKDIRALIVDLKESQVHTFVSGRKIKRTGKKRERVAVDIFTEGMEVLEHSAFRDWKNRTGKFGADLFGCEQGEEGNAGGSVAGCGETGDNGVSVEFDVEADLEMENEF